MKYLTDWNCHLLPMMGEWITSAQTARRALLRLHERTGLRRFCMMAEFDPSRESLPCFLLERDRAMREVAQTLPPQLRLIAGAYLRLREGISDLKGLERLRLAQSDLFPILLPWNDPLPSVVRDWHGFLYHTTLRPLIMDADHFLLRYPSDVVERLLRLEPIAYQFGFLSLADPAIRRIIRNLHDRNACILIGTGIRSVTAAECYDFGAILSAARADFGEDLLRDLLTHDLPTQ